MSGDPGTRRRSTEQQQKCRFDSRANHTGNSAFCTNRLTHYAPTKSVNWLTSTVKVSRPRLYWRLWCWMYFRLISHVSRRCSSSSLPYFFAENKTCQKIKWTMKTNQNEITHNLLMKYFNSSFSTLHFQSLNLLRSNSWFERIERILKLSSSHIKSNRFFKFNGFAKQNTSALACCVKHKIHWNARKNERWKFIQSINQCMQHSINRSRCVTVNQSINQ